MAFERRVGSPSGEGRIVENGDLNAGNITSEVMNTKGLRSLTVMVNVTRPGAGITRFDTMAEVSLDGLEFFEMVEEIDGTNITGAGTTLFAFMVDVVAPFMRIVFTPTSAAAGDVMDVDAYARD